MKPTRRKTVLGLGALATGSGAVFSSASFQDSVNADADMRVVVDENLTARAGDLFSSLSAGQYDDEDGNGIFIGKVSAGDSGPSPTEVLFGDSTTVTAGQGNGDTYTSVTDDNPGSGENRIPTPAAVANDGENGNFAFAIALGLNEKDTFSDLIEVDNQTQETADIGITFETFGDDVSSVGKGTVATEIYRFEDPSNSDNPISPTSWSDTDSQTPANHMEVTPGNTKQISLVNNTGGGSGVSKSDITSAIDDNGNPVFGETFESVDLVDTIKIGEDA